MHNKKSSNETVTDFEVKKAKKSPFFHEDFFAFYHAVKIIF